MVAFEGDHAPAEPALSYRIRDKDRQMVISGDTRPALAREACGVDLLVHDALSPRLVAVLGQAAERAGCANPKKIFADIPDYHATPEQAATLALEAGVRDLLFNHVVPPLPLPGMETAFVGDAPRIFAGPLRVGRDGDFLSLPAGSRVIHEGLPR